MKVYIAGALFTGGQRHSLEQLDLYLRNHGVQTFLPHRDVGFSEDTESVFLRDVKGIHQSDVMIALIHGRELDSGTAWEIGYARARGVRVFGIIDDVRIRDQYADLNIMIAHSVEILPSYEELLHRLISLQAKKTAVL